MLKIKVKRLMLTVGVFVVLIFMASGTFAGSAADGDRNWNVKITSDTKEDLTLENTQDITFKVPENPNIVKGKIAPGTTAVATINLNLTGTSVPVDLDLDVDDKNFPNNEFNLSAYLDGEKFEIGQTKVIELENNQAFTEENGQKIITIELRWEITDSQISEIQMQDGQFVIPITIKTQQHIGKIDK